MSIFIKMLYFTLVHLISTWSSWYVHQIYLKVHLGSHTWNWTNPWESGSVIISQGSSSGSCGYNIAHFPPRKFTKKNADPGEVPNSVVCTCMYVGASGIFETLFSRSPRQTVINKHITTLYRYIIQRRYIK